MIDDEEILIECVHGHGVLNGMLHHQRLRQNAIVFPLPFIHFSQTQQRPNIPVAYFRILKLSSPHLNCRDRTLIVDFAT